MNHAYHIKEEFSRDGKCLKRERTVGAVVPWMVVAILAIMTGSAFIPPSFWGLFKF